jgi:hypothetical protein
MHRTLGWVPGAEVVVAGAGWLAVAALIPQPARAQYWVGVAISPSTFTTGEANGKASQAVSESTAIQACSGGGAKDCKILGSTMSGCLALAYAPTAGGVHQYGFSAGPTREAAAASALAACTKAGVANCYVTENPCAGDDPRGPSPLPLPPTPPGPPLTVDSGLVGIWQATVPGGIWLWQIAANGTYTFRCESTNYAPSHVGTFTASNGKYTLHAYNISWDDQGTYTIQPGDNAVVFSGKLGTGTYTRVTSNAASAPATGPAPTITIRK